jgi:hypothetical protein
MVFIRGIRSSILQECAFLEFRLGAQTMKARLKSVEKFKDKVRELTQRSHNLGREIGRATQRQRAGICSLFRDRGKYARAPASQTGRVAAYATALHAV